MCFNIAVHAWARSNHYKLLKSIVVKPIYVLLQNNDITFSVGSDRIYLWRD